MCGVTYRRAGVTKLPRHPFGEIALAGIPLVAVHPVNRDAGSFLGH